MTMKTTASAKVAAKKAVKSNRSSIALDTPTNGSTEFDTPRGLADSEGEPTDQLVESESTGARALNNGETDSQIQIAPAPAETCATQDAETEAESALNVEIQALWEAHQKSKATSQRSKEQLKRVRSEIGECLFKMKALLARTGRSGGWAAYLRVHKLPRATADRYVRLHESALSPAPVNRLTEALSQPTEEETRKLVGRMLPRLCKVLPSPESFFQFVQALALGVPAAAARLTEFGVEVFRTVPEGAVHRLSPQPVSETVDHVSIVSSGKITSARLASKRPLVPEASRPEGEVRGSPQLSEFSSVA